MTDREDMITGHIMAALPRTLSRESISEPFIPPSPLKNSVQTRAVPDRYMPGMVPEFSGSAARFRSVKRNGLRKVEKKAILL